MKKHAGHITYTGHVPPWENNTGPKAGFLGRSVFLVPSSSTPQAMLWGCSCYLFHWLSPGTQWDGFSPSRSSGLGAHRIRESLALRAAREPSLNRGNTQAPVWVHVWSKVTQHTNGRARSGTPIRHLQVVFHTATPSWRRSCWCFKLRLG